MTAIINGIMVTGSVDEIYQLILKATSKIKIVSTSVSDLAMPDFKGSPGVSNPPIKNTPTGKRQK